MLGPLVRAQLTALLTKKLVESPVFNAFVANVHGTVTSLQQEAYDSLLKATQEHDQKFPHSTSTDSSSTADGPKSEPHRPRPSETSSEQNEQLRRLIEKTKRDIDSHHN